MRVVDIKNLDHSILPTKYYEQYRSFDISKLFEQEFEFEQEEKIDFSKYKFLENEAFYNIYLINDTLILNGLDEFFEIKKVHGFESVNSLYKLNGFIKEFQTKLTVKNRLDKPLNLICIFEKSSSFYTQNLKLVFKENCQVIETFYAKDLENSFINVNREYQLKENIKVDIAKIQLLDKSSIITNYKTIIEKNSSLNLINLEYKANLALNIFDSQLKYENSSLDIQGVLKLKENQKAGNIAFIAHFEKNTKSDIKIKHLLDNKSHALFDITSKVENSAVFAKAFQNSQTILLSDDARINANPRLEIYVDELEASHGASSGSLDEEQLYYLCSRGISKTKAKKMIIESIELQVINSIKNETIKDYLLELKRRSDV